MACGRFAPCTPWPLHPVHGASPAPADHHSSTVPRPIAAPPARGPISQARGSVPAALSVEVELEVERPAALTAVEAVKALLERVKAAARLRLRVQRVVASIKLPPLLCRRAERRLSLTGGTIAGRGGGSRMGWV